MAAKKKTKRKKRHHKWKSTWSRDTCQQCGVIRYIVEVESEDTFRYAWPNGRVKDTNEVPPCRGTWA